MLKSVVVIMHILHGQHADGSEWDSATIKTTAALRWMSVVAGTAVTVAEDG